MSATLYIKDRCPYCREAMEYLDQHGIAYEKIEVRGDDTKLKELKELSGQTKTPTLVLDGRLLADFGVNELKHFLEQQKNDAGDRAA